MATVTTTTSAGLPVSMMAVTPHRKLRVAGTQLCLVQTAWVVEDLGSAVGLGVVGYASGSYTDVTTTYSRNTKQSTRSHRFRQFVESTRNGRVAV